VIGKYLDIVRKEGMSNAVLIMPRRAGDVEKPDWNVTWANAVLRDILNPSGKKMPGTTLRLGDRIIVRSNMRVTQPQADDLKGDGVRMDAAQLRSMSGLDLDADVAVPVPLAASEDGKAVARLVNGDTGFIAGWHMDKGNPRVGLPSWVELQLDDGRKVWIGGEDVGVLDHAYALTVHAVQGSEYKHVLVCVTDGGPQFMNANMLLTAFSRAKESLHVWGDARTLKKIAATSLPQRNSALVQRVSEHLGVQDAQER